MKRAIVIVTLVVFVSAKLFALIGADPAAASDVSSSPVIAHSVVPDSHMSPEAPCCKQHDAAHGMGSNHCFSDCKQTLASAADFAVDHQERWSAVSPAKAIALEPSAHFKPPIAF